MGKKVLLTMNDCEFCEGMKDAVLNDAELSQEVEIANVDDQPEFADIAQKLEINAFPTFVEVNEQEGTICELDDNDLEIKKKCVQI